MGTIADIADYLESFAPRALAADWDNVGLLLGDRAAPLERVMTCLTVTPASAAEAVAERAGLIVSHHPVLFRPVQRLTTATSEGAMLLDLVRANVAVYSAHTAFDSTRGGINDLIACRLGLTDIAPLRPISMVPLCKLVVFVPENDLAKVSGALFGAGAGRIGEYSECSFRLLGTGTFFGSDAAHPVVGQKGRREEVSEWRLEVVCPEARVAEIVAAMRRAHSYEEPAFDVYPLRPVSDQVGGGRLGRLRTPQPLAELARTVKSALAADSVQLVGEPARPVNKIAIACGAGGEFLADAVGAGADVLLTGEARFHELLAAQAHGLALLLPGHYASERLGAEELARLLQQKFPEIHTWVSQREKNPLHWL